jgi:hypothetical protein
MMIAAIESPKSIADILSDAIALLEVNPLSNTLPCVRPTSYRPSKGHYRTVRFSDVDTVASTITRLEMSQEEIEACWWTQSEMASSSKRANVLVDYTRQQGKSFIAKTIDRAFDKALCSATKVDADLATLSSLTSSSSPSSSSALRKWAVHCNARRGLEKYVTGHKLQLRMVNQHRQAVLASVHSLASDDATMAVSIRTSTTSCCFARMMGDADAYYVSGEQ